jgi:hypothetical protein
VGYLLECCQLWAQFVILSALTLSINVAKTALLILQLGQSISNLSWVKLSDTTQQVHILLYPIT